MLLTKTNATIRLPILIGVAIVAAGTLALAQRPDIPAEPDAFGYRVYEHTDAECGFDFIDIDTTGNTVIFTASGVAPADDDGGAVIPLIYPFELYGAPATDLVMSSNGYLALASSLAAEAGGDFSNDARLPAVPDQPPGVPGRILAYHDELSGADSAGAAYYEEFASCPRVSEAMGTEPCTIFQWDSWAFPGGGDPFDLQAVVYHDSFEIVVQIRPGGGVLTGGTVGIQNSAANFASQYRPGTTLTADTAVCFFEPRYPPGGPVADLEVSKSDRVDVFTPGIFVDYEIGIINLGPSPAFGAHVSDVIATPLVNCSWTCVGSEGSTCAAGGTGDIDDVVDLAPGGWADYVLTCDTPSTATGASNTVTVVPPGDVTDPDPSGNSATDVNAGGAGRVPDGVVLPGPGLLRIGRSGGDLVLSWGPSCLVSDVDYHVYEGVLGDFASHAPVACGTGGSLGLLHPVPVANTYYIVVPSNLAFEGSYGIGGTGTERPAATSACHPQAFGSCP